MNPLKTFEGRVRDIFGATPQGLGMPFSFKKLAKLAARGMENETREFNGVDTAPALYNILVSPSDYEDLKPIYPRLASEVVAFVEDQAHGKGYMFVGKPVARFMPHRDVRNGKFDVVAENVDARTLESVRREEEQLFGGGPAAANGHMRPIPAPAQAAPAAAVAPVAAPVAAAAAPDNIPMTVRRPTPSEVPGEFAPAIDPQPADESAGLKVIPADFVDAVTPGANIPLDEPNVIPTPAVASAPVPAHSAAAAAVPTPAVEPAQKATCKLIDHQSGRVYTAVAPVTPVGRLRAEGAIALRDPNISRRHAELTFDGRDWTIRDLNSTNGTLVNNVEVERCVLRDGDLVTLGLLNLEFRKA